MGLGLLAHGRSTGGALPGPEALAPGLRVGLHPAAADLSLSAPPRRGRGEDGYHSSVPSVSSSGSSLSPELFLPSSWA
jgi:hypothetical protein